MIESLTGAAHSNTIAAEIVLPSMREKLGILEVFSSNHQSLPQSFQKHLSQKQVVTSKKDIGSNNQLPSKKPKAIPLATTTSHIRGNVMTTQTSADALLNTSQSLTTGDKSYQCSLCTFSSQAKSSAKRHVELKHLPKTTIFKCQLCDFSVNLKFNLKRHYVKTYSLPDQAAKAMLD